MSVPCPFYFFCKFSRPHDHHSSFNCLFLFSHLHFFLLLCSTLCISPLLLTFFLSLILNNTFKRASFSFISPYAIPFYLHFPTLLSLNHFLSYLATCLSLIWTSPFFPVHYFHFLAGDVEGYHKANNLRPAYRAMKKFRLRSSAQTCNIRKADGGIMSDADDFWSLWEE